MREAIPKSDIGHNAERNVGRNIWCTGIIILRRKSTFFSLSGMVDRSQKSPG